MSEVKNKNTFLTALLQPMYKLYKRAENEKNLFYKGLVLYTSQTEIIILPAFSHPLFFQSLITKPNNKVYIPKRIFINRRKCHNKISRND